MLRCVYLVLCLHFKLAHGMTKTDRHEENLATLQLDEAAPVPTPQVGISDERRQFATSSDHGRSEGWESRQAPGNGVCANDRRQTNPVKIGSGGRNDGTSFSARIRKRVYKRAISRAGRGPTMYRGKQYILAELQGQYEGKHVTQPRRQKQTDSAQQHGSAVANISCLTWNCGGLSNTRDEC